MHRRSAVLTLLTLPLGGRLLRAADGQDTGWTRLERSAWDTYLGKPFPQIDVPSIPRNDRGEYTATVGYNIDPSRVFSVVEVDGAQALRISGEIFGALITRDEYANYHLRFEFKWGEKRWPPREQAIRDSGCCYHSVGAHGASYGFWMRSFEFQLQEGDCGDFYSLAGVIVDAEAVVKDPANPKSDLVYTKAAPTIRANTRRIIKDADAERPTGTWNTIDLYCLGQTSVHVVNGRTVMALTGLRQTTDGREVPLTRGRIQLQSEGCEVFYRNIVIRPIREIPRQ